MAKQGLSANPEGETFPFTVPDKSISFNVHRNLLRGNPYFTIACWRDKVRKREVLKIYDAVRQRRADLLNKLGRRHAAVLRPAAADVCAQRRIKELAAEVGMHMETAMARAAREFLAAFEDTMRSGCSGPPEEWQRQWLQRGEEWLDSIVPLANGFFGELRTELENLSELQRYVAQLKLEEPERFAKPAEDDGD